MKSNPSRYQSGKFGFVELLVCAAVLATIAVFFFAKPVPKTGDFKTIPDFESVTLLERNPVTKAVFIGSDYTLLNVWASWCGYCKREHHHLVSLAQQGVPIIGLNYKDQDSKARSYLKNLSNPYTEVIVDPRGKIGRSIGVKGTPQTFLIDGNGWIVKQHFGTLTAEKWNKEFSSYFNVSL